MPLPFLAQLILVVWWIVASELVMFPYWYQFWSCVRRYFVLSGGSVYLIHSEDAYGILGWNVVDLSLSDGVVGSLSQLVTAALTMF